MGLRVIDPSVQYFPVEIGYFDTPGFAYGVTIDQTHVFIADSSAGLRVLSVYDPANPVEIGYYDTPGYAYGVAVSGNYAFVADCTNFTIYDCSQALAVGKAQEQIRPSSFVLRPCYPNPFNSSVVIRFEMRVASLVDLTIYDIKGREVWRLESRISQLGTNEEVWDANSQESGIYFVRLEAGDYSQTQKVILLK
jgi:hypothetical protein